MRSHQLRVRAGVPTVLPDVVYVFTGTIGSVTTPAGYSKVTVEVIAAGGLGRGSTNNTGGGGGGGGYSRTNDLAVTGGSTVVYYSAGLGVTSGNAGLSWVNIVSNAQPTSTSQGCFANYGIGGAAGSAGAGGSTTGAIGDVKYAGGNGFYNGVAFQGAGGGAAGADAAGSNATAGTGGAGGGSAGDMKGGSGGNFNAAGTTPGGGGGSQGGTSTNLKGGDGRVRITFKQ